MRYWSPFIEEALDQIQRDKIDRLIVLPLYPQFSVSTTGSSLNRMHAIVSENGITMPPTSVICSFEGDPNYIGAMESSIQEKLEGLSDTDASQTHILFSAHSVPVRYINEGDPYLDQTKRTVKLVMDRIGNRYAHTLSFQSKVGPVEWLTPATNETIPKLAREGVTRLILVPVSFVSEHSETLYEMDILYRDLAAESGITDYRRVSAMNCRRDFIDALAFLVERALAGCTGGSDRSVCLHAADRSSADAPSCACEKIED